MSLSACCAAPSSAASLRAPTTAARGGVLDGHVSRGGAGRGSMGAAAARGLSTSSRLTTPARFLQQGYGGRLVRASRLRMECAITRVPSSDDEPREGNDPRGERGRRGNIIKIKIAPAKVFHADALPSNTASDPTPSPPSSAVESPQAGDGKQPANSNQLPQHKREAQLSLTSDKCGEGSRTSVSSCPPGFPKRYSSSSGTHLHLVGNNQSLTVSSG